MTVVWSVLIPWALVALVSLVASVGVVVGRWAP